ncbi:TonB-dependent receptor [Pedobacter sp. ASV1-7]|uniref:SusC/RagA family TonB-linked outer membrane protein n=1 Tax=Pedobacter sp. ASV1-7 TaxID=3145237 RepID=UPI0032E8AE56
MKLSLAAPLLLMATLQAHAFAFGQKITLQKKNVKVDFVLKELQKQSGHNILFEQKIIPLVRISPSYQDAPLEVVLKDILEPLNIQFRISNKNIVLSQSLLEEQTRVDRNSTKTQRMIKGKVHDKEGKPISGASVQLNSGTSGGVLTAKDGSFSILAKVGDKLTLSYIGMESLTLTIETTEDLSITMRDKAYEMDDVVVVAFGKQKKGNVVGSITSVKPENLKIPSSNLTTALAGNVAGVIAYQRSGEPGQDNADFFVRGITTFGNNNKPLILIDGVELTTTDLARLQPDDIASFSVMKDATATALYGARGANGVILVNTKEGKEGVAKVSLRLEHSSSAPTQTTEIADPITFMKLNNEAVLTRNPLGELPYSQTKIENTILRKSPVAFPTNDWSELLLKDRTTTSRGNLSVSGGGPIARYYVATSFAKDNGILKVDKRNNFNSNIDNTYYTLRSNVNVNLTKTTELIVRLSGTFDDYQGPLQGGAATYNMIMHSNPVMFPAFFPVDEKNAHLQHIMFGNYDNLYTNPYAETVRGYKERSRSQILAQIEVAQDLSAITRGLSMRGMFNVSRLSQFAVARSYNPYYYQLSTYDNATNQYSIIMNREGTEYLGYSEPNNEKVTNSSLYFQSTLNYSRLFAEKHQVNGLLVGILREELNANTGSLQLSLPSRNLGVSGRATYAYDNRYFAEFNFGYNGSERFAKNKRYGFFPSIGGAWYVSNEKFWEELRPIFSKVKFRGSYGLVGNDNIGSAADRFFYLSEVNMNNAGRAAYFGQNMNSSLNGISISRYANPEISWEISRKRDLALEIGLFDKVNLVTEYFTEKREKILMSRSSIPSTMGLQAVQRANVGEAKGKGIDVSLDYTQNWNSGFWTSARANFTYARGTYNVYEEPAYENEPWRSRVGHSINQQWGYVAERLFVDDNEAFNSPIQQIGNSKYGGGDVKYTDINKDGKINDLDRVAIGNPTVPEIVYGFGLSMGYKQFDISAFFQGVANQSFWIDAGNTSPFQNETQLLKAYADNYWSEETQNIYALWPRLSTEINSNNVPRNTWFMRDGTFLRLKQVEIGYTLSDKMKQRLKAKNLRIYLSGTNLLLFSKFKLWDIEMAGNGLGYPLQRVFNAGINVQF